MTKCWFILTDIRQTILLLAFWECIDLSLILKLYFFKGIEVHKSCWHFYLNYLYCLSIQSFTVCKKKKDFLLETLQYIVHCNHPVFCWIVFLNIVYQILLVQLISLEFLHEKKNKQANSFYNYTHYAMENYFENAFFLWRNMVHVNTLRFAQKHFCDNQTFSFITSPR